MPIRFRCTQCKQKLSITTRKAGQPVVCPRCRHEIRVPLASPPAGESPPAAAAPTSGMPDDSPPQVELPEDDSASSSQWLYVDQGQRSTSNSGSAGTLVVSRRVVYCQGALLGIAALAGFALGRAWNGERPSTTHAAREEPAELSGAVTFRSASGRVLPDIGAAVLIVPAARQPERSERPQAAGLRPGDPMPEPASDAMRVLRLLGGNYVRVGNDGRYSARLPQGGRFRVLVLSQHARRDARQPLAMDDLAQIGRYVLPPTELLGQQAYRWRAMEIQGAVQWDVAF